MNGLRCDDVSHRFGDRLALARLTVAIPPGRVTVLIGLNGAGKTTALRLLAGRARPNSGVVRVLGHDPTALPPAIASRFGHVIGAPLVWPELTVVENLICAARLHGLTRRSAVLRASAAVEAMGLDPWREVRAGALSMGNHQRLGIGCATLHRPAALILDEPTSALDPRGVVLVRELIRGLAAEGAAVLVSSHHLDEVARIADEIVVLHDGREIGRLEPGGTDLEQRFFAMVLAADLAADRRGSESGGSDGRGSDPRGRS